MSCENKANDEPGLTPGAENICPSPLEGEGGAQCRVRGISTVNALQMSPEHEAWLRAYLSKMAPHLEIWAFGSRTQWTAREASDLDLVLRTPENLEQPLPNEFIAQLKDNFNDSDLPFLVDILDWATVSPKFRRVIERNYVVLQPGSKWQSIRLGDICVKDGGVQTGPFGSQLHQKDYVIEGTPIITVEHLGDNRITTQNLPCVSNYDRERLSKYSLKEGDIVFSRVGSVDRRALVRKKEEGWLFSGRCLRVRLNKALANPEFISFQFGLEEFKEYMRSIAVGATMPSLNTKILSDAQIILPSLPEQKAIAAVLSALDDKIELNRRMNTTLEAMARTLFKDWFIDFGPVKAKAAGLQPPGLDPDIAAFFPDALDDEGIPVGWEWSAFSDLIELIGGSTPKTSVVEYWNGDIPWYSVMDAPASGDVFVIQTEKFITQEGLDNSSTRLLPTGTTIISARGTVGKLALVGTPMTMNQSCYGVNSSFGEYPYFNYFLMKSLVFSLQSRAHGSVFDTITRDTFKSIEIIKPPVEIVATLEVILTPLMQFILKNQEQSKSLAKIRDTILPKVLSGEVRVQDVEWEVT